MHLIDVRNYRKDTPQFIKVEGQIEVIVSVVTSKFKTLNFT